MTISAGGYTPPRYDPPPIYEETSAHFNLEKLGETGKGVVIVPPEQSVDVPFTKFDNRNRWPTSSQADNPILHQSLAQLRGAPADPTVRDDQWQGEFQQLVDQLDPDLAAEVNNPTLPETPAFRQGLELIARASVWTDSTVQALENPEKSRLDPAVGAFADEGYTSALSFNRELGQSFNDHLEDEGPNSPTYDESKGTWQDINDVLREIASEGRSD